MLNEVGLSIHIGRIVDKFRAETEGPVVDNTIGTKAIRHNNAVAM